jgi:hypothetical protein
VTAAKVAHDAWGVSTNDENTAGIAVLTDESVCPTLVGQALSPAKPFLHGS